MSGRSRPRRGPIEVLSLILVITTRARSRAGCSVLGQVLLESLPAEL